jgi:glutamate formiminotransferase/formiminotetrahydrofolate cyclodeaminase
VSTDQRVVECVPNFSEGRDAATIAEIAEAIRAVAGVTLLHVDPGADANRTVMTFIGEPDAAALAAFQAIAAAARRIDMTRHTGVHPRLGATDVCPFVPVAGVTLAECAAIARQVGERVGRELQIPVYLYEAAASRPERRNLADIRRGEYEGLAEKLRDPRWAPDFGPARFNPRSGATAIGARRILIAFNITLNTPDRAPAVDIALELRQKGRGARRPDGAILTYGEGVYPCGNCEAVFATFAEAAAHCRSRHGHDLAELLRLNGVDPTASLVGRRVSRAGMFSHVKAIGWTVEAYGRAQVSMNLTDHTVSPPHLVLEAARRLAAEQGLAVTGSELVGLIPYPALREAGRYYLAAQGKSPEAPAPVILETAVRAMGLDDLAPFDLTTRVLGLPADVRQALTARTAGAPETSATRDGPAEHADRADR